MRKLLALALLMLSLFIVTACDFGSTTTTTPSIPTTTTTTSATNSIPTSTTTSTTSSAPTSTTTTSTAAPTTTPTTTTAPTTTTTTTTTSANTPLIPSGYSLLQDELDVVGMPATGNVKVLVFAVDFPDYPSASRGVSIADIQQAFNGSSASMAFESLQSFYLKSSFGKLNITADVYGYYRAPKNSTYYANLYETEYPDSDLIYDLLEYYDSQINYADYDSNKDGFIDGLYVIYTTPVSYESGSDLWWAYMDSYIYEGDIFDGVEPYYFVWHGTDFFLEGDDPINARTLIHETGHLLGLEDYYDYDPDGTYNVGGLGGADMMDYTVGDHNPFSKMLLGWITPLVVTSSMTVDIMPYIQSGDVLLIINEWKNTIFDEYLLIMYYTPTDLYVDDSGVMFSISGIAVYHVSAKIDNGYQDNGYYTIFNNNNTDTVNKLIRFVEADGTWDIEDLDDTWAADSDLFQVGDVLRGNILPNLDWYDTAKDMRFTVTIVSKGETAAIQINFAN